MELTQRNSMSFRERREIQFHLCGEVMYRSAGTKEAHTVGFLTQYRLNVYMCTLAYGCLNIYGLYLKKERMHRDGMMWLARRKKGE